MQWFVKAFLKASLAWLSLGVTLGVAMAAHPTWTVYRAAHVHMTVLGFVTMMIYGVAYHVVPRFAGAKLHGERAAGWHWWASNAGLALMVTGFVVRANGANVGTPLLAAGGALSAAGAYTFAYVVWRTIDGGAARSAAAAAAALRPAPPPPGERAATRLPVLAAAQDARSAER
ncbi:MAG TPA: cbb3-type cytochrome c oxidase subunit I [Gemmatimonadaceae bacterium]|nr:cbb3-type cytochrome c oxidase subunit I [Gemmatimonadaceae bacterium]